MDESPPRSVPAPPATGDSHQPGVYRVGDHLQLETPAGALDIRVIRTYLDGTVDILCTCCGARWERRRLKLQGYDLDGTTPAA